MDNKQKKHDLYVKNKDKWKEYYQTRKLKVGNFKKVYTYQEGKIYKIVCDSTNEIYIGSTKCPLNDRLSKHKYDSKRRTDLASSQIIKRNNYHIELIENYPCNNSKELLEREQYWMLKTVNINIQSATLNKREYDKQHKRENKEHYNRKRRQLRKWDNLYYIDTTLFL